MGARGVLARRGRQGVGVGDLIDCGGGGGGSVARHASATRLVQALGWAGVGDARVLVRTELHARVMSAEFGALLAAELGAAPVRFGLQRRKRVNLATFKGRLAAANTILEEQYGAKAVAVNKKAVRFRLKHPWGGESGVPEPT